MPYTFLKSPKLPMNKESPNFPPAPFPLLPPIIHPSLLAPLCFPSASPLYYKLIYLQPSFLYPICLPIVFFPTLLLPSSFSHFFSLFIALPLLPEPLPTSFWHIKVFLNTSHSMHDLSNPPDSTCLPSPFNFRIFELFMHTFLCKFVLYSMYTCTSSLTSNYSIWPLFWGIMCYQDKGNVLLSTEKARSSESI